MHNQDDVHRRAQETTTMRISLCNQLFYEAHDQQLTNNFPAGEMSKISEIELFR